MADNKTYYYMKINKDFFDDDTVKYLEEQEYGKDFIILYLKLCLKSLEDEGLLIRYVGTKLIPYDTAAIAKMTDTDIGIVKMAMKIFEEIELIEKKETGELFMSQIQEMIGTDTYDARRKRKQRAKDKILNDKQTEQMGQCPTDVPQKSHACPQDVPEYKSIELEKEIELEEEQEKQSSAFAEISNYYQSRIGIIDGQQYQKLTDYLTIDGMGLEVIKTAIDKAADNSKRSFSYINSILKNWRQNGIRTMVQVEDEQRQFQQKKQGQSDDDIQDPFIY